MQRVLRQANREQSHGFLNIEQQSPPHPCHPPRSTNTTTWPCANSHVTLRGPIWVAGDVIKSVAEVDIVDILSVALERPVFLPHTEPFGLGRGVRRQPQHVQYPPELVTCHGADAAHIEVLEERKQLDLSVLNLRPTTHRQIRHLTCNDFTLSDMQRDFMICGIEIRKFRGF